MFRKPAKRGWPTFTRWARKCQGMLAERTINTLLGLNIGTYVALDVTNLPQLVDAIDTVSMELDRQERPRWGWISAGTA